MLSTPVHLITLFISRTWLIRSASFFAFNHLRYLVHLRWHRNGTRFCSSIRKIYHRFKFNYSISKTNAFETTCFAIFLFFFTIGEIRNLIIIYKYIVQSVAARRKKKHKLNKYVIPLIVGFMLIKSILLPIALKTLAILSGKAVVLSLMSLILAAIVGLKKVAQGGHSGGSYEVLTVPHNKYKRQDYLDTGDDLMDTEPYKFYRERRRRK